MRTLALLFLTVGVALGQNALCATSQTAIIGALGRNACSLSCHAKLCGSGSCVQQTQNSNTMMTSTSAGGYNSANARSQPFYDPYGNGPGSSDNGYTSTPYYNPYNNNQQGSGMARSQPYYDPYGNGPGSSNNQPDYNNPGQGGSPYYDPYGNQQGGGGGQGGGGSNGYNGPYYNPYGNNQGGGTGSGYDSSRGYNSGYANNNGLYNNGQGSTSNPYLANGRSEQYQPTQTQTTQWVCQCEKCN